MIPSSADLTYFLEVAATRNISRAAERLGITQPALSLALKRLENTIGTELLIRTKVGVQLTKPGVRVAARARDLIDEWHKLRNDALRDEHEISGRYCIGCHPSVALYSLPHFLPNLL